MENDPLFQPRDLFSVGEKTVRQWRNNKIIRAWSCDDERMMNTDEVRPYARLDRILVTSSHTGGLALVQWSTGDTLVIKSAGNAHCALLCGDGRLLVAASLGHDYVELCDPQGHALSRIDFKHAHALVWASPAEKEFWALGADQLWRVRIENNNMTVAEKIALPETGAHDMMVAPGGKQLWIATRSHVFRFDPVEKKTGPHPVLGNHASIKCILADPDNDCIGYVQGNDAAGEWWSHALQWVSAADPGKIEQRFSVPDKLYKIRRAGDRLHLDL
jgi:hypothetical protein